MRAHRKRGDTEIAAALHHVAVLNWVVLLTWCNHLREQGVTVVIGGLSTSTALTLLVLPTLYAWFVWDEVE